MRLNILAMMDRSREHSNSMLRLAVLSFAKIRPTCHFSFIYLAKPEVTTEMYPKFDLGVQLDL